MNLFLCPNNFDRKRIGRSVSPSGAALNRQETNKAPKPSLVFSFFGSILHPSLSKSKPDNSILTPTAQNFQTKDFSATSKNTGVMRHKALFDFLRASRRQVSVVRPDRPVGYDLGTLRPPLKCECDSCNEIGEREVESWAGENGNMKGNPKQPCFKVFFSSL